MHSGSCWSHWPPIAHAQQCCCLACARYRRTSAPAWAFHTIFRPRYGRRFSVLHLGEPDMDIHHPCCRKVTWTSFFLILFRYLGWHCSCYRIHMGLLFPQIVHDDFLLMSSFWDGCLLLVVHLGSLRPPYLHMICC